MFNISLFVSTDNIQDMVSKLIDDGVIGVHGSRVHVRDIMKKICATLNSDENECKFISSAYNHPETELGYIWDNSRYEMSNAKNQVVKVYESKLDHEVV